MCEGTLLSVSALAAVWGIMRALAWWTVPLMLDMLASDIDKVPKM